MTSREKLRKMEKGVDDVFKRLSKLVQKIFFAVWNRMKKKFQDFSTLGSYKIKKLNKFIDCEDKDCNAGPSLNTICNRTIRKYFRNIKNSDFYRKLKYQQHL